MVFLDKTLFTTYTIDSVSQNRGTPDNGEEDEADIPPFEISILSLIETLQILGISDASPKDSWSARIACASASFVHCAAFGIIGLCRISYEAVGDPFRLVLEESGMTTTCELTTYAPSFYEEIPLQKDAIIQKIIMRSTWLNDAILELSSTSPTRLTIRSSPEAPHFTLSSTGPLGSATVEFTNDPQLLETFQVSRNSSNTYNYHMIRSTSKAMAAASKVSLRSDEQGVLSLQFMIELDQESKDNSISFVDFRFVPYLDENGEDKESPQNKQDNEL